HHLERPAVDGEPAGDVHGGAGTDHGGAGGGRSGLHRSLGAGPAAAPGTGGRRAAGARGLRARTARLRSPQRSPCPIGYASPVPSAVGIGTGRVPRRFTSPASAPASASRLQSEVP